MKFKNGEWIRIHDYKRVRTGWVVAPGELSVMVKFLDQSYNQSVQAYRLKSHEQILPEVREEFKEVAKELSLMTRDKDWFMEVTNEN